MIVVDASALLEVLLQTPDAQAVEARLLHPRETLHAPHLLDVEVGQVIRRYATNGGIDVKRGGAVLDDLTIFPCADTPMIGCCRACGNCETISPPMTPYTLLSLKRSNRRCSHATDVSQMLQDIVQRSS